MADFSLSWAALPNLHPAAVHFPLALLPAAVAFDLAGLVLRRQPWLDRAAAALYLLAALGAGGAFLTGRQAEDGLSGLPPHVQPLLAGHADWAQLTLIALSILAVARFLVAWRERTRAEVRRGPLRALLLFAALGILGLLVGTADRGGSLVYGHGVAVVVPGRHEGAAGHAGRGAASPATGPPEARLVKRDDGGLVWSPLPGDVGALGTLLKPAGGGRSGAVLAASGAATGEGLALSVSGRALLLLPGSFDDVYVQASLGLEEFKGNAGVAHHARGLDEAGLFCVGSDGRAELIQIVRGEEKVLDEASVKRLRPVVDVAVSGAGSHLKGTVDGELAAHGHLREGSPGGVGLFFDGNGTVRVIEVRVVPLPGQ